MSNRKVSRRDLRAGCDAVGPGDGQDPRLEPRLDHKPGGGHIAPHKLQQLCAEAARTVSAVLAGCGNELLRDLIVVDVVPAPSSARLLVTLTTAPEAPTYPPAEVLDQVRRAAGLLRYEVASAVRRRKAPELLFQLAGR